MFDALNRPSFQHGVLTKDVTVWLNKDVTITLPKGLVVRDTSERGLAGIGQFENKRFSITVTSDFPMVDYDANWKAIRSPGSLYPAIDEKLLKPTK